MNAERKCTCCGRLLPSDAPAGHCPECLIQLALEAAASKTTRVGEEYPPSPRKLESDPGNAARVQYFGDYELIEEIARGGMGVVWKARQSSLNRVVALKMILAGRFAGDAEVRRFRTEAEAAANLQHPNIVAIHEIGEHEGQHYFSMEYVEGKNLGEHLKENSLPAREAAELLATVARAVHYAHQRGILHRDLKPGNILIDAFGKPQVTDFGLAKRIEAASDLTQSGAVLGTPNYMAPEQARGTRQVTTSADVFSLGAILYQLLTGRAPFQAETPLETLRKLADDEPPAPSSINKRIDIDLETICLKCLEKDARKRYASADALANDLERWRQHQPILARPSTQWERGIKWTKRHPAIAALSLLVAFVTTAGIAGIVWQWRKARLSLVRSETNLYFNRIARAQRELSDGNSGLAERLLEECPIQLRHWEWHYLDRLGHVDHHSMRAAGRTIELAFSHDGERLATASTLWKNNLFGNETFQGLIVEIWNTKNGRKLTSFNLPGGTDSIEDREVTPMFLPDNHHLATRNGRDIVAVWNVETGQKIAQFNDRGQNATRPGDDLRKFDPADPLGNANRALAAMRREAIAFSVDGSHAAAFAGGDLKVWNLLTGAEVRTVPGLSSSILNMRTGLLSANGQFLAAAVGREVRLWNLTSREPQARRVLSHAAIVAEIAFSPDNHLLAAAGEDGTIRLWDAETAQPLATLEKYHTPINWIRFNPDGTCLASVGQDRTVKLWETRTGREFLTIPTGTAISSLVFSSDGTRFTTMSRAEGIIKIWDAATGKNIRAIQNSGMLAAAHVWSPDGQKLATVDMDTEHFEMRSIKVWNLRPEPSRPGVILQAHTNAVRSVAFSADGRYFGSGGSDRMIRIWDSTSHNAVRTLDGHEGGVNDVAFSADGAWVASAGADGTAKIWNLKSGAEIRSVRGYGFHEPAGQPRRSQNPAPKLSNEVISVSFSRNDRQLAALSHQGLLVMDTMAGGLIHQSGAAARSYNNVAFSSDGLLMAVPRGANGRMEFWNFKTNRRLDRLNEQVSALGIFLGNTRIAFAPDGRRVAAGNSEGKLRLFDLPGHIQQTAAPLLQKTPRIQNWIRAQSVSFTAHIGAVTCLVFTPDGHRLVSSGEDGVIKIWDANSGQEILALRGHAGAVNTLALTPDGHRLLSGGLDGTVRIWDGTPLLHD